MKLCFVLGTRPEAIKLWPVVREATYRDHQISLLSTGQQADLLPSIMREIGLQPTKAMLRVEPELSDFLSSAIRWLFPRIDADAVLVQGDTTTALAGALAAYHRHVPVVHVEAGLRTYERTPFPEEANRRMISHITTLHCAPTRRAYQHLFEERCVGDKVLTGNTIVDAVNLICREHEPKSVADVVVTLHRRENWAKAPAIAEAVVAATQDLSVLWVLHGNPDLAERISKVLDGTHVTAVPPMDYTEFLTVLWGARAVLTDSGGVVEEATSLGTPTLVLRDHTERVEANAELVRSQDPIDQSLRRALVSRRAPSDVFGDGEAATRILDALEQL